MALGRGRLRPDRSLPASLASLRASSRRVPVAAVAKSTRSSKEDRFSRFAFSSLCGDGFFVHLGRWDAAIGGWQRQMIMDDEVARAARAKKGSPFLSTEQAAFYLGLSARKLQAMRSCRTGPAFRRHSRYVRYHIDDLDSWSRSSGAADLLHS